MENKFVIFFNDDFEPCIVLARVSYHKYIKEPTDFGKIRGRCGGGKWNVNDKGELKLYDVSGDFGKYDKDMAKEAFDKKNVYYFDDKAYDDFCLKTLKCE